MDEAYPEDCISLSCEFVQPLHRSLFRNPSEPALKQYCTATGLLPGEIERLLKSPFGTMSLQPTIWDAIDIGDIAFMPPDYVMRSLVELYDYNYAHSIHNRRRVDMQDSSPPIYAALGSEWLEGAPIFTRHPRTCIVTAHLPPYTTLPNFSLRSIHPSLLAVRAHLFVLKSDLSTIYPLVGDLAMHSARHVDPAFRRKIGPPPPPNTDVVPTPASTRKRKIAEVPASPAKRQKIATATRSPPTRSQHPRNLKRRIVNSTLQDGLTTVIRGRTYYPRGAKDAAVAAMAYESSTRRRRRR